eukprot:scaffold12126_cov126-Skeletonema_marinoi.AAC.1
MGVMGRKEAATAKNNKKRLGFGLKLKSDTFNSNLDAASNSCDCEEARDDNITFSTDTEENAEYLQTRDGAAEEEEEDFNVNVLDGNRFSCAHNGGFVANRFSCANTVGSDSASSIKTLLKPITSLLECGQAHAADYGIFEPAEKMSSKIPSIAQISQLQISDHAFIKRSNGVWTYSTVLEIGKDSIAFSVDEFGNEKNITKHRWLSNIRQVKSSEDEEDVESTVAEEYSMSISSSGSDDYSEDASPAASPSAADRKAQLKAKAKAAAAEAKRKEREMKEAQELEVKLRLLALEEHNIKKKAEVEKERLRILEVKEAKKMADLEKKKKKKLAKKEADLELKRQRAEEKMAMAQEAQAEKEAKVEMKKLQKARQHAAALEAQRQAQFMFKNLAGES